MEKNTHIRISSISEFHEMLQLPKPLHPLISLVDNIKLKENAKPLNYSYTFDFYGISYKYSKDGKIGYGQGYYDFSEGGLVFIEPNQLLFRDYSEEKVECYGHTLFFHKDFIRNYALGLSIKKYGFFSYNTNEALHLSDIEKKKVIGLLDSISDELNTSIDELSQDVLVSYINVLLDYSNRFYKRQFITRKMVNSDILTKIYDLLEDYFNNERLLTDGLPTVEYLASQVNLSPRYLSDMLRTLIGQNTQQVIHEKLIEKAKEKLSTSNLSVSEIAYELGFEHPQSFNKLFKKKTKLTPMEFKQSLS